jgi:predicted deacylase
LEATQYPRGGKYKLDLEAGHGVRQPVLLARGPAEVKRLAAIAAVHGDEYEGVEAIFRTFESLDPEIMRGDFLAVPVANPPAFWNGTRENPVDGCNLARVFPGDAAGSCTAAVAWRLAHDAIDGADFFIDLHSGGVGWEMPLMAGYDERDARARAAALAFGAKVIWGHPSLAPGRSVSFAAERGIPWLYTEARGAGRIDGGDLRVFCEGLRNLMRHLGILPGAPLVCDVEFDLTGDGNIDAGLSAGSSGFFVAKAGLLDRVEPGEELGVIRDLHGETLETVRAPEAGWIAMVRRFPVVRPGVPLFVIAQRRERQA